MHAYQDTSLFQGWVEYRDEQPIQWRRESIGNGI